MEPLFDGLSDAFSRQSLFYCGIEVRLHDFPGTFRVAKEKYLYCLSKKKLKHYPSCLLMHADEYCSFLVFLARQAYLEDCEVLAEAAYLVNRRMHAFECFYTRETPDIFHLEHPVASVLGQAVFGDYLVVYQGVSVGGDIKLRYPKLGEGVVLFSKCSLIGAAEIGSNCAIGAGVQLYGASISDNIAVSNRGLESFVCSALTWTVKERFFKL